MQSAIERLINRKVEIGIHPVKQLKCKADTSNKFDMPVSKLRRIEQ